jgi:hypothetical protein
MRYLLFSLIVLILSKSALSQCDNILVGKWKVVAVNNGYTYFNLKTDSVRIAPEMGMGFTSDSAKQQFLALQKMVYGSFEFHFKNDSVLTMRMLDGFVEDVRYCYKKSVNKIKITSKNSLGEDKSDELPAMIKNELLYFTLTESEDGEVLELIMEKNKGDL